MAGFVAVLRALAKSVGRDLGSYRTLQANNFFLFLAVLMLQPASAEFLLWILGFLLLFPLSGDPLAQIPADRMAAWPLSAGQLAALRVVSLALSPITWIALGVLAKTRNWLLALQFTGAALVIQLFSRTAARLARKAPRFQLLRYVPPFPGKLGGLVRASLREMLSVLDPWVALLLCLIAVAYRLTAKNLNPDAMPVLALVVAMAFSTYAQSLFGLELPHGVLRYRLMPLRGGEILLAKSAAYLLLVGIVVLPLEPVSGLTSALVALAIGQYSTVLEPRPQMKWRFTEGVLIPNGLFQAMGGTAAGYAAHQRPWILAVAVAVWLASLLWYGRAWDRRDLPSES